MQDNVTISYRGATYEIGRGEHFYGIWIAGAPRSQPLEWWPETPAGWSSAWARFIGIEAPGTIVPVGPAAAPPIPPAPTAGPPAGGPAPHAGPAPHPTGPDPQPTGTTPQPAYPVGQPSGLGPGGPATPAVPAVPATPWTGQAVPASSWSGRDRLRARVAAGLLGLGVVLGVIGLFPSYLLGASLAQEPPELVPHVIYLAVWTAGAAGILLGGIRLRLGALLAAGTSIVTFGLFFADAGTAISGGAHAAGPGLVLSLLGWLACAIGSGVALWLRPQGHPVPGRPQRWALRHVLPLVAGLGGLGTAIAFAPSWDSYTLRAASGASTYVTAGNAFANPGLVITGDVFVMIAVVAVAVLAAVWRPVREGAVLLAGATIPLVAQAISALVGVGEATSPTQFGFTPAEASQIGLTITNGVTPAFWLYCAFVVVLLVTCAWLLLSPRSAALDVPAGGPAPYGPPGIVPGDATGTGQPGYSLTAPPGDTVPPARVPAGEGSGTGPAGPRDAEQDTGQPAPEAQLPGGLDQVAGQQQLGDGQRL